MNVAEMKKEITEKIGLLTENQLIFGIKVINEITTLQDEPKMDMDMIFKEAVEKYGNVLQKLAQ